MLSKVQTLYNCSRHIKIECVLIECVHVFQTVPHYVWQHRVPPVLKKPFRLWEKTQKCTYLFMPLRLCVQQLIQGEALVRHDVAPWRVVGTPWGYVCSMCGKFCRKKRVFITKMQRKRVFEHFSASPIQRVSVDMKQKPSSKVSLIFEFVQIGRGYLKYSFTWRGGLLLHKKFVRQPISY